MIKAKQFLSIFNHTLASPNQAPYNHGFPEALVQASSPRALDYAAGQRWLPWHLASTGSEQLVVWVKPQQLSLSKPKNPK